jgi:hypothetical protein
MTQVTVTEAELGQVIATDAMLTGITIETVPTEYRGYFTLVDEDLGNEIQLYNIEPSTSHVSVGTVLMAGGSIPFKNLTLKSIPVGSSFQLDYEPIPVVTPLPTESSEPVTE